jgi:chromosome segregation ATPase
VAAVAPARAAGALASPTREELETEIRGLRRQVTELQRRHHSDQARIASLERQVAQLEETILREAERTREEVKELQRSTREALEAKDGELAALRDVIDKLQVSLRDMLDISRRQGDLVAAAAAARPSGPHAFMVVQMLLLIAFVFVERLLRSGDASFTPS